MMTVIKPRDISPGLKISSKCKVPLRYSLKISPEVGSKSIL